MKTRRNVAFPGTSSSSSSSASASSSSSSGSSAKVADKVGGRLEPQTSKKPRTEAHNSKVKSKVKNKVSGEIREIRKVQYSSAYFNRDPAMLFTSPQKADRTLKLIFNVRRGNRQRSDQDFHDRMRPLNLNITPEHTEVLQQKELTALNRQMKHALFIHYDAKALDMEPRENQVCVLTRFPEPYHSYRLPLSRTQEKLLQLERHIEVEHRKRLLWLTGILQTTADCAFVLWEVAFYFGCFLYNWSLLLDAFVDKISGLIPLSERSQDNPYYRLWIFATPEMYVHAKMGREGLTRLKPEIKGFYVSAGNLFFVLFHQLLTRDVGKFAAVREQAGRIRGARKAMNLLSHLQSKLKQKQLQPQKEDSQTKEVQQLQKQIEELKGAVEKDRELLALENDSNAFMQAVFAELKSRISNSEKNLLSKLTELERQQHPEDPKRKPERSSLWVLSPKREYWPLCTARKTQHPSSCHDCQACAEFLNLRSFIRFAKPLQDFQPKHVRQLSPSRSPARPSVSPGVLQDREQEHQEQHHEHPQGHQETEMTSGAQQEPDFGPQVPGPTLKSGIGYFLPPDDDVPMTPSESLLSGNYENGDEQASWRAVYEWMKQRRLATLHDWSGFRPALHSFRALFGAAPDQGIEAFASPARPSGAGIGIDSTLSLGEGKHIKGKGKDKDKDKDKDRDMEQEDEARDNENQGHYFNHYFSSLIVTERDIPPSDCFLGEFFANATLPLLLFLKLPVYVLCPFPNHPDMETRVLSKIGSLCKESFALACSSSSSSTSSSSSSCSPTSSSLSTSAPSASSSSSSASQAAATTAPIQLVFHIFSVKRPNQSDEDLERLLNHFRRVSTPAIVQFSGAFKAKGWYPLSIRGGIFGSEDGEEFEFNRFRVSWTVDRRKAEMLLAESSFADLAPSIEKQISYLYDDIEQSEFPT